MSSQIQSDENKYYGFYRARVVEVDIEEDGEKNAYGAVRVFIPDVHTKEVDTEMDEFKDGILAYPANSPLGGYNYDDNEKSSYSARSVYTPLKNSYMLVFFEGGDISRCFYLCPWIPTPDPNDSSEEGGEEAKPVKLPPECRGEKLETPHKVVMIYKSYDGRAIVISDDPNEPRIEITGKKRMLKKETPEGDEESVYTIDGNQTTILIGEKDGTEQVLIKTHMGDFIHIDTDKQNLDIKMAKNISMECGETFSLKAKEIQVKSLTSAVYESGTDTSIKAGTTLSLTGSTTVGITSVGPVTVDAPNFITQSGASTAPKKSAQPIEPIGERY